ncbi:DUF4234 domain-containing protein [Archaeoglobus veneficus]|nr:DUF4234 domain-containing protein [Archaeoglobus veneficus]
MSIDVIERLVRKGEETDRILPVALMFVPPVLTFIGVLLMIASSKEQQYYHHYYHGYYYEYASTEPDYTLLALGLLFIAVGAVVGVYIVYSLISRRNAHMERTLTLYDAISKHVEDQDLSARLKESVLRMRAEQGESKNPILWIVIYLLSNVVPLLGVFVVVYIFHFLNKDFVKHDRNERIILEQLSSVLPMGDTLQMTKIGKFPDRNTVIYFVLTLLTFGLFEIYWFYTLIRDPNEHFTEHRIVEARILDALKSTQSG